MNRMKTNPYGLTCRRCRWCMHAPGRIFEPSRRLEPGRSLVSVSLCAKFNLNNEIFGDLRGKVTCTQLQSNLIC